MVTRAILKTYRIEKENDHHWPICMMTSLFPQVLYFTELQVPQDSELVRLLEQLVPQEPLRLLG